ncbi:uncharacterized protein BJ212DRAFT_1303436 [Suillus subaureus]|uniref:Uncharacterized protein n=1 Tax=Suillus subaureus TaxID=48587 RepID=A0A9P7DZV4_9AGAM|nr:uncharacterized protein BJ212DRAFT_1303436 [Suillus subaureus]KAG1807467.1 hypothetical protein BJ212DRAFT_1303436 [Suillus subaureus]
MPFAISIFLSRPLLHETEHYKIKLGINRRDNPFQCHEQQKIVTAPRQSGAPCDAWQSSRTSQRTVQWDEPRYKGHSVRGEVRECGLDNLPSTVSFTTKVDNPGTLLLGHINYTMWINDSAVTVASLAQGFGGTCHGRAFRAPLWPSPAPCIGCEWILK